MGWLERRFRLAEHGTTARREVTGGVVTFATLSYVLFVQPAVLATTGMDPQGVLFATIVASAAACFLMAWLANLPVALAPAMGHNVFFAFTVCGAMGFAWPEALAANLLAGLVFLALARTGFRERVLHAIPESLQAALAAGIGLLVALLGLEWGGIVVAHPVTYVTLGELGSPVALLCLLGLALNAVLLARRVRGAFLVGILGTAGAGLAASALLDSAPPLVRWQGLFGAPPAPSAAFALDLPGLFARPLGDWLAVLAILLILDLFDTVGSLLALGRQAGLLRDGKLPRAREALAADAAGTVIGATLGTSTITSYVESAAGIAAGARTGLAAATTGLCLLGALVLTPLVATIGAGVVVATEPAVVTRYPVIAPVLILVGALMLRALEHVAWDDPAKAIPAFLTLVMTPLTFSITEGVAWGFVSWSLLHAATGRAREVPGLVHGFAGLFVLRYLFLPA